MLDFNTLFEFSRTNCIAICAFLVPANLLLTARTVVLTALRRPHTQVRQAALLAFIPALVMILHVYTWLMIGVVMAPTYILFWMASICIGINIWAVTHSQSLVRLVQALFVMLQFQRD